MTRKFQFIKTGAQQKLESHIYIMIWANNGIDFEVVAGLHSADREKDVNTIALGIKINNSMPPVLNR